MVSLVVEEVFKSFIWVKVAILHFKNKPLQVLHSKFYLSKSTDVLSNIKYYQNVLKYQK